MSTETGAAPTGEEVTSRSNGDAAAEPTPAATVEKRRLPVVVAEQRDLEAGLMYVHRKVGDSMLRHHELEAHVYALTEVMISNGLMSLSSFEQRKKALTEQTMAKVQTEWRGARVLTSTQDKYEVEPVSIDCGSRIHLCKAACCRLTFQLSRQDLHEHVVRWDVEKPYTIRQREDGWCTHCDPATKKCEVHERRPLVCRGYDCRQDKRIWVDFEERVPNPDLARL